MRILARLSSLLLLFLVGCRPTQPVPERLELTPTTLALQFGEAQIINARAFVGPKEAFDLAALTWTSSDPALVTVTAGEPGTASVQGLSAGTATVTAQLREATATLQVTIAPRVIVLERIDLTPTAPTVAKGLRLQLHATGVYNDGSTRDLTTSAAWASADSSKATVTSGLVSGVGVGEVEVRALKDGVTGRVSLEVTAATVVGLDVRPAQASMARGTSQQFSASARLSDATTQSVTSQVIWETSDATVASVDPAGRVTAHEVGGTTLTAILGDVSGSTMVTVTNAVLRSLDVVPAALSLPLGSTRQLALTGRFSDATTQDLTSQAAWRSGTPLVASVSSGGLITATGLGLSVITATVDGISASTSVTCTAAQLQTIHVAPQGLSLAVGLTRSFTATGLYTDSSTQDLTAQLTWSSSDGGVASVSNASAEVGLVRARSEGTTTISATNGTLTGDSVLTIAPAMLVSLAVSPVMVNVPSGLTQQLSARGTFSDGSQRDVTAQVTWVSSAPAVASVSNAAGTEGLLSALALGTASVTASAGLVSASLSVQVGAAALQRLDVTAPATSLAAGRSQQLTATGVYSDGSTQDLTSTVTWGPAIGTVLRVSPAGVMSAVGVGTTDATATLGAVVGSASLTVTTAELDSLTVTPATPSLALGLTQALVALGLWSDGSTQALTTGVSWSSADAGVATVSAQGLVSSVAQGEALITATAGAISGSTTVTVTAPALTTITVTPVNPSLEKTQTQQLSASGSYTDGSTASVTGQVSWQSSAPGVASVSSTGEVTAVSPGTSTLSATLAGVTGSTSVTVNRPALSSLDVTPASMDINWGATFAFTAVATYVDASTEVVTDLVSWSSSDTSLVTISAAGLASGNAAGTVTITAQWGAFSGTAQLTVNPPVLQAIAVSGRTKLATAASVQLVATGTWSDNSTSDLTAQATWDSSAPGTALFTNLAGVRGTVQGLAAGNATATATIGTITSPAFAVQALGTNAPFAGRCGPGLVISQLYGGGGNAGAVWRNDFIELHNPTTTGISLNGLSLQYTSSAGTSWGSNMVALANVVVPAGGYYLVQLASGGTNGSVLTSDQSGTINMSATAGKVALVSGLTGLTGPCPTAVLDLVGFGSTADCSEGAVAPTPSATTWLTRGASGCRDGNQNGTDFTTTTTVTPRTLASTALLCSCFVNGTAVTEELNACVLQSPANLGVAAGEVSAAVPALVTQPGVTDGAGFDANLQVQVGFGPSGVNPTSAAGWRWWPMVGRTPGTVSDGYDGVFLAPSSGGYGFTARASRDGVNWTACDLNGAGSGAGLAFEMGQLGVLTVP